MQGTKITQKEHQQIIQLPTQLPDNKRQLRTIYHCLTKFIYLHIIAAQPWGKQLGGNNWELIYFVFVGLKLEEKTKRWNIVKEKKKKPTKKIIPE